MKRGTFILSLAVGIGICMFICTRLMLSRPGAVAVRAMPTENGSVLPELHWLQHWLALDDAQMAKVSQVHLAYLPKCEDLCHRVTISNEEMLRRGAGQTSMDAGLRAAINERAKLTAESQEALLEHVYRTAACLRMEQSKKYLDLMLPYTLGIPAKDAASSRVHP